MSSIVTSIAPAMATAANTTNSASGGSAAGAPSGGAPPAFSGPSSDEMVYWLDISLLIVVGVFFLAFLPRFIGRFSLYSEWTRGFIFRSGSAHGEPMQQQIYYNDQLRRVNTVTTLAENYSDQSHTYATHTAYTNGYSGAGKEWAGSSSTMPSLPSGVTKPPAHVPALSTLLHPISSLFSYQVSESKTIGKAILMAVYLAGILLVVFIYDGNPLASSNRLGFIATSQIPVAVALATKNNVVGMLLGMGYERINFLHRWVGIITFSVANLHAIAYIYKWAINEQLAQEIVTPLAVHGLIGLIGVSLLFFASQGFVRQKFYAFFLFAHIVGITLFFVGICFHEPACIPYVALALGIYGFDHLLRLIKTRIAVARLTAVPELGLTRVEIPTLGGGWRAGQHVRLRVLGGGMGMRGCAVAHPFTIASASEASGKGLVVMCKKAGGWTKSLYAAASQKGVNGIEEGYVTSREVKVIVEGPYGGMGNMVMSSYSSVLLVAGGSGLTFATSQAEELVQAIMARRSAVKFLEIVWVTQDKASLTPLLPTFSAMLGAVAPIPGVVMRITVHYSRPGKNQPFSPDGSVKSSPLDAHLATLAPSLTLTSGRPALTKIMSSITRLTSSVQNAKGVAVGVCGPLGLVGEVKSVVRGVDSEMRNACGGVELHEEFFGW